MLGAHPRVHQAVGLVLRLSHGTPGVRREAREHQSPARRRAYFLWTACLLTPRCSAISCHDQPWLLAFPTWRASSRSRSWRRAATARSPMAGSSSATAVASLVASLTASSYVDDP